MKKHVFFLFISFLLCITINAQITLNQSNTSFTPGSMYPVEAAITGFLLPNTGINQQWNYSNLTAINTITLNHIAPSNLNFPTATYKDTGNSAAFIPGWYYYYDSYTQTSVNGVNSLGFVINSQHYGIPTFSNPNDSCILTNQFCVYGSPSYLMHFPTTMSTSWTTTTRSYINFELTISTYSLNHTPCQKVTNTVRKDTVIGYGKMRVPTASGPSLAYDVLMIKRMVVQTDSFYMNGVAAPAAFLNGFGVTQGQITTDNRYMFWRENARYTLLMVNFGSNNFTTASSVIFDGSAVADPSSINEIDNSSEFSIYPNPNNGSFSIYFNPEENESYDLKIYNMLGQIVHSQKLSATDPNSKQIINNNLNSGTYFVSMVSKNKRFTSKFLIK